MLMPAIAGIAEAAVTSWLSPSPGQLVPSGKVEVAIGYNTQSDAKVTTLELYVDGKFYARKVLTTAQARGVASFWWDATRAAKGSHDLVVKVFAGDKLLSKLTGSATIGGSSGGTGGSVWDTRPPTVRFSNIKAGDVLKGETRIRMDAYDDSGKNPMVSLLVDNSLKLLRNTPPYAYDLDTTTYTDGGHQLQTYAYDEAGNKSDPAVVKVEFKNGQQKPVVTSMTVEQKPIKVTEEDGTVVTIPANVVAPTNPTIRSSAGRTSESTTLSTGTPSAPIVRVDPAPVAPAATVKVTPVATAKVAPPTASSPTRVMVASLPSTLRTESGMVGSASPMASEPSIEPEVAVRVPIAAVSSTVETISGAAVSSTSRVAVSAPMPKLKSTNISSQSMPGKLGMPTDSSSTEAVSSAPKTVRVAMAPDTRSIATTVRPNPSIATPPPVEKPVKARIEKKVVPLSGKVKVRDLVDQLGGIVFWDAISHTVTIHVGDLCIEMQIGSDEARVNGRDMHLSAVPAIVDGRTIVDAGVYHQACAFAAKATKTAQAK